MAWEVEVRVDGEQVVTIGSEGYLAGLADAELDQHAEAVREAGKHLLAFIGDGKLVACFLCGGLEQCEPDCPLNEDSVPSADGGGG